MGTIREHPKVLAVMAVFSSSEQAIAWGLAQAEANWGPLALKSELFSFEETQYYESAMGKPLQKQLLAFERRFLPDELPQRKRQTNAWEAAYATEHPSDVTRPLNLDPGYLTEAKLILATTKDRDHRIYLADGVFAECTLYFHRGAWRNRDWTYPDYQKPEYHQFFEQARRYYREQEAS